MRELTRRGESPAGGASRLIAGTRSLYRAHIAPLTRSRPARATTGWVAAAAVIAGLVVFIGSHDAYPTTKVPLESGQAWVASQQIGSLTLLDGVAAQPVTNVPVTRHVGDPLATGQIGTSGYAIDQLAGRLTRVDGSSLKGDFVDQSLGGDSPSVVRLYAGVNTLYVVDGADGLVSTYNASTLRQLGAPERFASAGSDYTAAVDGQGRLWVLDGLTGALTWITATGHGSRAPDFTAGAAVLTLADERPVVVDRSAREAYLLGSDGATGAALSLGAADGTGIQATGAATQAALLVTTASQGTYKTCTFATGCDLGQCVTPGGGTPGRCVGAGADTLGPAVAADGRVFIPDYSNGGAWIVDPSAAAKPFEISLLPLRGPFELFDAQGVLFFNDPHSNRAGTLAPDGTVRPIVKYAQASASPSALPTSGDVRPSPSTSTSAGSGGASGEASGSRTPPGTGRATVSPSKGAPTTPASSGSPSASPSPTSSTGPPAGVTCGQTVTASITLRGDLHCTGDGLIIGADHVTVDLAGHTLTGGGTGAGITLAGSGSVADALIENGVITRFGDGVEIGPNGATSPTLDRVDFTHDGAGGGAAIALGTTTVQGLTLTAVTVKQADGPGLDAHGVLTDSLQIAGSTFDGAPVNVDESVDGIAVQTTITDDQFDSAALTMEYVGSTTVSASTFTDSPVLDMCNAAGGDVFKDNTFDGADIALKIEGMSYEIVTDNHFTGNGVGMFYQLRQDNVGNSVSHNTFADEGSAAILVEDSSPVPQEVDIEDNDISGSGRHPSVTDPGGNSVVGGIHIYAPAGGVVVSGNHTGDDAGYGIWAQPGTATGSGNVSSGDADRCSPVTLCTYG